MDTAQEQPVDSISADIAAAFDQLEGIDNGDEPGAEPETDVDDIEEAEGDEEGGEGEHEEIEEEIEEVDPPHSWNKQGKEIFKSLPSEAQEYITEREKDRDKFLNTKSQEASETIKKFDALEQILGPRRQEFQMSGLDDAGVVRQLFAITDGLRKDPVQMLTTLATQFGVDLNGIGQEEDETTDPAMRKIEKLEKDIEDERKKNATTAQQQRTSQLQTYIQNFADEKDDTGNPKHPRFEELRNDIGRLMNSGLASDLGEAYKKAESLKPVNPKSEDDLKSEKAEKAKKAKRAAAGVKSSTSKSKNAKPLSLKEELAQVIGDKSIKF